MPPKKKTDAPAVKPGDAKLDDTVELLPEDNSEADTEEDDTPHADAADKATGTAPVTVEFVDVDEPCKVCYPDGWPVKEDGASVSCFHGWGLRYGTTIQIPRDIAEAAGLV